MNPIKNGWLNNVHKEINEEAFNSKGEYQRTTLICKEIWGISKDNAIYQRKKNSISNNYDRFSLSD